MGTITHPAPAATVTDRDRLVGRIAWVGAWFGLVSGQLHALARHRTEAGREDLQLPLTKAWDTPVGDLLSPLLDWADPDLVYVTYGKLWLPVFVAFTLAAFVARRHRAPTGFEKWVWRIVLVGYVGACVSIVGEYWTQWTSETNRLLDIVFVVDIPFMLITLAGSTILGVTLLAKGFRPRLAAVLLTLTLPGLVLITQVTSLGNVVLPIAFAFGTLGRRWAPAGRLG